MALGAAMRSVAAEPDPERGAVMRDRATAAHRDLVRAGVDARAGLAAHRAFHLALLTECPNRRLHDLCVQLHDHTQRFQVAGARYRPDGDAVAEHQALLEAFVTGDVDVAVRILTAHLGATLSAVRALG
jgi:DNA-binding GntR family transcriptional regulator